MTRKYMPTFDRDSMVNDTAGNAYTIIPGSKIVDAGGGFTAQMAYALNIKPGANTVTPTFSSSFCGQKELMMAEYSGVAPGFSATVVLESVQSCIFAGIQACVARE